LNIRGRGLTGIINSSSALGKKPTRRAQRADANAIVLTDGRIGHTAAAGSCVGNKDEVWGALQIVDVEWR